MRKILTKIKLLSKRKKIIISVISFIILISTVTGIYLIANNHEDTKWELKQKKFVIEFGEQYSLDAKDYIKADEEVIKQIKIKVDNPNATENKDKSDEKKIIDMYPVAEYHAKAIYKDSQPLEFRIEVKDTTKPKFIDFQDRIEVPIGEEVNLVEKFKAEDLSEVTITVDTKEVDFNKVGEYEATVIAEDAYKNRESKEFTIIIIEKQETDTIEEESE